MKPPEALLPDASDPGLQVATEAFKAGDFKRARSLIYKIERDALRVDDQEIYNRLDRGLRMDPLLLYGLIGCAAIWFVLFWQNTGH